MKERIVNFIEQHTDKLLVTALLVYMLHFVLLLTWMHVNAETISWARELVSGLMGALLGLVTGVNIGRKQQAEDKKNEVSQ